MAMANSKGLAGWLVSRLTRPATEKRLRVVEQVSVAPRRSLALVECDGQSFLVCTSGDGAMSVTPVTTPARGKDVLDAADVVETGDDSSGREQQAAQQPASRDMPEAAAGNRIEVPARDTAAQTVSRYLRGTTTLRIVRGGRQVYPRVQEPPAESDTAFAKAMTHAVAHVAEPLVPPAVADKEDLYVTGADTFSLERELVSWAAEQTRQMNNSGERVA